MINNRYEFICYIECVNGNPNGDPDMGNMPRMDPQDMHGYITDVAIKRRVRNYVQSAYSSQPGMGIIMQSSTNLNRFIAEAHENVESQDANVKGKDKVNKAREYCCKKYFDVRTFGAVLAVGANAGQVRGPIQIAFARSVEPILPQDISITRMLVSEKVAGETSEAYLKWEAEQDESKLRTMGRKQFIAYGLYEVRGFISANLADETGFGEDDLAVFFEALQGMYEHDRSASKGIMSVISPVVIFRHVGTDSDAAQRAKQSRLGCAPAHKLFDLVSVQRKDDVKYARSYKDYVAKINMDGVPKGVDVGFMSGSFSDTSWNVVPHDSWITKA